MFQRVGLALLLCLLLLLALDSLFIYVSTTVDPRFIAYTANGTPYSLSSTVNWRWLLEGEGSYGERFQYAKEFLLTLVFLAVFWRTRAPLALVGAAFFFYTFFDDMLGWHEGIAFWLKHNLGTSWALLGRQSLNEVLVFAAFGGFFAFLTLLAYRQSSPGERSVAHIFFALLGLLFFCGVGLDLLHALFKSITILPLIEDGGEMIVTSLLLVASLVILRFVTLGPPSHGDYV